MKLSSQWKTLNRDQRRAWNAWAKSNKVLLDNGDFRRVSGHKAMTMVLRNRAVAGEAANPAVVPAAVAWLDGALTLADAGPFTAGIGYIGFRCTVNIEAGTKFFVWASPVVAEAEAGLPPQLRFVGLLTCAAMTAALGGDVTANLGAAYRAVCGEFRGPGANGQWTLPDPEDPEAVIADPHYVWLRLRHYANGQLSPGLLMRGMVVEEL